MKKTVKSRSDLNAKALRDGGTITNKSGQKFNATGKKTATTKKIAPKKKIEKKAPEKVEKPKPDHSIKIKEAVDKQTIALTQALEALKKEMSEIKAQHKEPIFAWDFKVIRNDDGTLDIKARVPDLKQVTH